MHLHPYTLSFELPATEQRLRVLIAAYRRSRTLATNFQTHACRPTWLQQVEALEGHSRNLLQTSPLCVVSTWTANEEVTRMRSANFPPPHDLSTPLLLPRPLRQKTPLQRQMPPPKTNHARRPRRTRPRTSRPTSKLETTRRPATSASNSGLGHRRPRGCT